MIGKRIVAILVCALLFAIYVMIGVALGWKHGGGTFPAAICFSLMVTAWKIITAKGKKISADNSRKSSSDNACKEEDKVENQPALPADSNSQPEEKLPVASQVIPQQVVSETTPSKKKRKWGIIIFVAIVAVLLEIIPVIVVLCGRKASNPKNFPGATKIRKSDNQSAVGYSQAQSAGIKDTLLPSTYKVSRFTQQLLREDTRRYSTAGHPKSQGLDVAIEIPKSWKGTEGRRTHVVQSFDTSTNRTLISCTIMIKNIPTVTQEMLRDVPIGYMGAADELQEFVPPNAKVIRGGVTGIDGEKTVWVESTLTAERVNMTMTMHGLQYIIPYKGRVIMIGFSCGSIDGEFKNKAVFAEYLPVFQKIIGSVVINSKWGND